MGVSDYTKRRLDHVQRALDAHHLPSTRSPTTPEEGLAWIQATRDPRERAHYAFEIAHMTRSEPLTSPRVATLVPLLFEVLEQSDDLSPTDGVRAAQKLFDFGLRTEALRSAIERRHARGKVDVADIGSAVAQLVPGTNEHLLVTSGLRDNEQLVARLEKLLFEEDWSPPRTEPAVPPPAALPPKPSATKGTPAWIVLPILALGVLGVVGFVVLRAYPGILGSSGQAAPAASPSGSTTITAAAAPSPAVGSATAAPS